MKHAARIGTTTALLAAAATWAGSASAAPPMSAAQLGSTLPSAALFPGEGLTPGTERTSATGTERAPSPCASRRARGIPATDRWGEWGAAGRGRSAGVVTFSYGDEAIDDAWRRVRAAVATCPRTRSGASGTVTQVVRASSAYRIHLDVVTRSARAGRTWGADRSIVLQRADDSIQVVQVSRPVLTRADRTLLAQVAAVGARKYVAARNDPLAATPADDVPPAEAVGDTSAPIRAALDDLAPGAKVNVSIGDSFISGEAGRWRGNVYHRSNFAVADAFGPSAYWDTPTGESMWRCNRSRGAEIHVPGTVGLNLACSGAITKTKWSFSKYKPGIDDGAVDPDTGKKLPGQLTLLAEAARSARVGTVVLSIGGNDMGFAKVMLSCMQAFMTPEPFARGCRDKASVREALSDEALAAVGDKVQAAIERTHATMQAAGYADRSWNMIVQGYPVPLASSNRYAETYADRVYRGGCPFYDDDVRWIASARMPVLAREIAEATRRAAARTGQPTAFLDLSDAFAGRELCARGTEHVDRMPADQVVARAERVSMVRMFSPFLPQEGVHPNALGQQALQACLRHALGGAGVRSGRCHAPADWAQVDADGLPLMRFTPAGS